MDIRGTVLDLMKAGCPGELAKELVMASQYDDYVIAALIGKKDWSVHVVHVETGQYQDAHDRPELINEQVTRLLAVGKAEAAKAYL